MIETTYWITVMVLAFGLGFKCGIDFCKGDKK